MAKKNTGKSPQSKNLFSDWDDESLGILGKYVLFFIIFCVLVATLPTIGYKREQRESEKKVIEAQAEEKRRAEESRAKYLELERRIDAEMAAKKASNNVQPAIRYDEDDIITLILDDVDVEDLYDYYDFEPPRAINGIAVQILLQNTEFMYNFTRKLWECILGVWGFCEI